VSSADRLAYSRRH